MTASTSKHVWFITGASSGFGRLVAEKALQAGDRVIATARNVSSLEDLQQRFPQTASVLPLDVTQPDHIKEISKLALATFGYVDVLVNNAGYGLAGAIEETSDEEYEAMFQTNIYGVIRTTRAFLPHFRERKSGYILNLSSIAGLVANPGWGFYAATKFAIEGFSEAHAAEMRPLGVYVTLIEPGPFRTEFLGRSGKLADCKISDYDQTAGKAREYLKTQNGKQSGDPDKAAEALLAVANSPDPPVHLLLGRVAVERWRNKLSRLEKEMATWSDLTEGTDFAE